MQNRTCLACGAGGLEIILDLGHQSPVNSFTDTPKELETYPLRLEACSECGHGQLSHFIDPKDLFSDYLYASSTSQTLKQYSKVFAACLGDSMPRGSSVLEIACNDGVLLRELSEFGFQAIGIDPAERMHKRCQQEGLNTICDYWPSKKLAGKKFDMIIGQNVFAHNPDPLKFLQASVDHLSEGGIVTFQTSQADMVANGELDTIYHEHYSFFSEESARALAERAHVELLGTAYTAIHGNSAVYFFGKTGVAMSRAKAIITSLEKSAPTDSVNARTEGLRKRRNIVDWKHFSVDAVERMKNMRHEIETSRRTGLKIVAVGAAAKGITFLRAAGLDLDLLVDEAPDKVGKWVSGLDLQVSPLSAVSGLGPSLFIISAWNFADELSSKIRAISQSSEIGSKFIVYFPSITVTDFS